MLLNHMIPYAVILFGSLCFAITYRAPRRYFFLTVLIAFISGTMLRMMPPNWHIGASTFFVSLLISSLSHVFARLTRAPAQCFLIPGIIFLVPGAVIYRAFNHALEGDLSAAEGLGISAFAITLGISFGILIANWVVPPRKAL